MDDRLLAFLKRPESWPGRPGGVEHRETHISHVFLCGDSAFKFKKPVSFGFLDFTTLRRRLFYCRRELLLNARLAPDIYRDVIPVYGRDGEFSFAPFRGARVVEYAVRMRRYDDASVLACLVERGRAAIGIDDAVRRIAAFHHAAPPYHGRLYGGRRSVVMDNEEDFRQIEPFIGRTIGRGCFDAIAGATRAFMAAHRHLFEERKAAGLVREIHGDLHCEHVCLADPPFIVDCIEFNNRFRIGDVLEDIAFLLMDLAARGRWDLARRVKEAYFASVGIEDVRHDGLLRFYKVYRAVVRGKVEGFTGEGRPEGASRDGAFQRARDYFGLALRYLERGDRPFNPVVLMGPSGSGKTHLAGLVAAGATRLNSDRLRKELAGIPAGSHAYGPAGTGLYAPDMTDRVYRTLADGAIEAARRGGRVVVDATFIARDRRMRFHDAMEGAGLDPLYVWCTAHPDLLRQRVRDRVASGRDASDATVDVLERQLAALEPPGELASFRVLRLDTSADVETLASVIGDAAGAAG